jgi:hypothetical protein
MKRCDQCEYTDENVVHNLVCEKNPGLLLDIQVVRGKYLLNHYSLCTLTCKQNKELKDGIDQADALEVDDV